LRFPGLGGSGALAFSILTALLFVLSILAHELAHAVMFRLRGIRVLGVTLHMFGGVTEGGSEAKRPWDEFIIAVVGPLTTGLLGAAFLLARNALDELDPDPLWLMLTYLGRLNVAIGLFNLLPGFPLDGGRVLLAGVWAVTGDRARAMTVAARVGQGVALLIGGAGLIDVANGGGTWGIWPLLIGLMLFQSSSAALAQSRRRTMIAAATAGQIMSTPPPTLPADLPIAEALARHLDGHDGEAFPVMDQGRVVGFISPGMARSVAVDGRVRDAMVGTDTAEMADPDERMESLIGRIGDRRIQTVLVMKDGRLVGVIEPEDMERFFRRGRSKR
jgi:Zn-dependent protease